MLSGNSFLTRLKRLKQLSGGSAAGGEVRDSPKAAGQSNGLGGAIGFGKYFSLNVP